ncbi:heme-binding protein 2 [Canna indica]|uniref:Heme-binding protein 2 n=1 Tax=Canna indica TaxID=4628 RepID=A0AAQ3JXP3_9LILI|nr:heme-binding protein 2 [Canna indica]
MIQFIPSKLQLSTKIFHHSICTTTFQFPSLDYKKSSNVEAHKPQKSRPNPHYTPPSQLHSGLQRAGQVFDKMRVPSCFALLPLLIILFLLAATHAAAAVAPSCERIECPGYDVVDEGNGFEIRRYSYPVWMSTSAIDDISFVNATRGGFLQLFDYIQGKNKYGEEIEMTAPVITQISPSDGPFCASSFVVSFYVPKKNQANPPPAEGLHLQKWGVKYAAVRQFGGFVSDGSIGREAGALYSSLEGSSWFNAVNKGDPTSTYTVAQYNSPFEFTGRVNEIWMMFDVDSASI